MYQTSLTPWALFNSATYILLSCVFVFVRGFRPIRIYQNINQDLSHNNEILNKYEVKIHIQYFSEAKLQIPKIAILKTLHVEGALLILNAILVQVRVSLQWSQTQTNSIALNSNTLCNKLQMKHLRFKWILTSEKFTLMRNKN